MKVAWKVCARCNVKKLPHEFSEDLRMRDSLRTNCRECVKALWKTWNQNSCKKKDGIKKRWLKLHPNKKMTKRWADSVAAEFEASQVLDPDELTDCLVAKRLSWFLRRKSGHDKSCYRPPTHTESLPHIDCLVEQLRRLVQAGGDPLFWRVALRRVASELERPPGVPHEPASPPVPKRVVLPEPEKPG